MKEKTKPAKKRHADSLPYVEFAIKGIEEKKGNEIVCLDLQKISNSPCDYFVICEANSRTQVQAIAGSVEEYVKKETGSNPWHVEGLQNAEWVLMDYVNVVVHIFQPHIRQHFGLEDMWADAEIKNLKPVSPVVKKKKTVPKIKKTVKKKIVLTKKVAPKKSILTKKKVNNKK